MGCGSSTESAHPTPADPLPHAPAPSPGAPAASTEETPALLDVNKQKLQGSIETVVQADSGKEVLGKAMSMAHKGITVDDKTLGAIWDQFGTDGKLTMGELEPLVKKVFEQVKLELTEAKVELEAYLSKELQSKFFADLSPKERAALLKGLMDGVETCTNMGKGRMDELIANPTESTETLFEKLDIDKDGSISREEFLANGSKLLFEKTDIVSKLKSELMSEYEKLKLRFAAAKKCATLSVGARVSCLHPDGNHYTATIAEVLPSSGEDGPRYVVDWDNGETQHRERPAAQLRLLPRRKKNYISESREKQQEDVAALKKRLADMEAAKKEKTKHTPDHVQAKITKIDKKFEQLQWKYSMLERRIANLKEQDASLFENQVKREYDMLSEALKEILPEKQQLEKSNWTDVTSEEAKDKFSKLFSKLMTDCESAIKEVLKLDNFVYGKLSASAQQRKQEKKSFYANEAAKEVAQYEAKTGTKVSAQEANLIAEFLEWDANYDARRKSEA